jgi:hypothetical protein
VALGNAYALPFDGYEPHPDIPGAYHFTPAGGGSPILAAGPEAERMRALIDRAPAPQQLASNAPAPAAAGLMPQGDDTQMRDFIQAQQGGQATPGASLSHAAPVVADPRALSTNLPTPTAAGAPQPQATPQEIARQVIPPPSAVAPAPSADQAQAGPQLSDLDKGYKIVHSKGGWQPSSQKVTTEGAIQDPALAKATTEAIVDKMRAEASSAEAQKLALTAQVQQSQIAAADAAKEADQLEKQRIARLAAMQAGAEEYGRITGIKQKELEAAGGKEVDQFRMYRGRPGAQIGAAIAGALGAFGSAIARTPNFALDIINKQIDNDVMSQREEIARGVNAKQNDLMRIRDKYGVDNNVAEKLLSISLTERAQALARKQAALQGGAEAQQKLADLDAQLAARKVADMKSIQDIVLGKAQVSAEEKYRQGGDSVVLAPQVIGRQKVAEATGKTGEALGKASEGEYMATHGGAKPPKAGAGGPGKAPARLSGALAINESAVDDIDNFINEQPKGFVRRPGTVEEHVTGRALTSDERDALDTKATAIVGKVVKGSNDSISKEELEHFREMLTSPYESVRTAGAKELKRALLTTQKGLNRAIDRSRGGGGVDAAIQDAAEEASTQ